MVVYIDIILLENFIVNLFILVICQNILREKIKYGRTIISAAIGSFYTLVMLIPKLEFFSTIPFILIVAFVMNSIALKKTTLLKKVLVTGIFIVMSVTLSGLCFMFSIWQNSFNLRTNYTINNYSIKYIIISIMIIYITMERLIFYVKDKLVVKGYIFDMEITVGKIKYNIKCFLDTGNELREPVTNLPCIIVEENYLDFNKFDEKEAFFINYNAVGYKGTLKGFKVDNLVLKKDKKEWKTITAIVCPCKEVLSKEREFNALLSRGVI